MPTAAEAAAVLRTIAEGDLDEALEPAWSGPGRVGTTGSRLFDMTLPPVRPARPATVAHGAPRIGSGTVRAERSLRAELHRAARQFLGPNASENEVQKRADAWYHQPPREAPPETAFERRRREKHAAKARADLERCRLEYGDDW